MQIKLTDNYNGMFFFIHCAGHKKPCW